MKIKQIPEDFIVKEVIDIKTSKEKKDYCIVKITKISWNTLSLVNKLSEILEINSKFIGFAGMKDKHAVTAQYFSLYKVIEQDIKNIKINDVTISFVGYSENRINLGDLKGNNFRITIRDIDKKIKIPESIQLENYFDEQRFGNKVNTHIIGKAIIKRDFKKACELLGLKESNNYIGMLRKQSKRLLRLYISAYQSYLWNKTLAKIISNEKECIKIQYPFGELVFVNKKMRDLKIPIINFDIKPSKEISVIMKEEDLKLDDFIIREMPELISESQSREAFIYVQSIKFKWSKDELNKGKLKLKLVFSLPKAAYATMLLKKLFSKAF